MLNKFNPEKTLDRLQEFPKLFQICFAASCCERLLPNYKKFVETEHWGDYNFLESTLDEIWEYISGKLIAKERLILLMKKVDLVTPDADDFNSIYTSFAIDAGGAIYETLRYCFDEKSKHLVDVASFARDTVDMFVQERDDMDYSDPDFETKILADPLMVKELEKQLNDLEILKNQKHLNSNFISEFRFKVKGKSNLNI